MSHRHLYPTVDSLFVVLLLLFFFLFLLPARVSFPSPDGNDDDDDEWEDAAGENDEDEAIAEEMEDVAEEAAAASGVRLIYFGSINSSPMEEDFMPCIKHFLCGIEIGNRGVGISEPLRIAL